MPKKSEEVKISQINFFEDPDTESSSSNQFEQSNSSKEKILTPSVHSKSLKMIDFSDPKSISLCKISSDSNFGAISTLNVSYNEEDEALMLKGNL